MSNEELVKEIREGINASGNMELLYTRNYGYIAKIAKHYTGYGEYEDLVQEAYFGLYEAVRHYEVSSNVKFMTFAAYWIKQAIVRYIEYTGSIIRIPSHMINKINRYDRVRKEYLKAAGREPDNEELMKALEIGFEGLKRVKAVYSAYKHIESLESEIKGIEDCNLGDAIPSGEDIESDAVDRIIRLDMKSSLWEMIKSRLTDEEYQVCCCLYINNMSSREAGEATGNTLSRVESLKASSHRKLRNGGVRKMLAERYEIAIQTAYRGSVGSFRNTWSSSTERAVLKLVDRN